MELDDGKADNTTQVQPPGKTKKPIKQLEPYTWKPGVSANPLGRPKGSRNALSELFIKDVLEDWKAAGPSAIQACRLDNPGVYLKVVASLVPKELSIKNGTNELDAIIDQLDPEQLAQICGLLAALTHSTKVPAGKPKELPRD